MTTRTATPPHAPSGTDLSAFVLVALSAAGFGSMAIFVDAAYASGANILGVLLPRFTLAALVLWGVVLAARHPLPARGRLGGLALRGATYVAQSFCFFGALLFLPAGMVALLLYLYPLFVVLLTALLGQERLTRRRLLALAICSAGTALTLGLGPLQAAVAAPDLRGVALAVGAAVIYAGYIVGGTRATRGVAPLASTVVVLTSAALVLSGIVAMRTLAGAAPLQWPGTGLGWAAMGAIAMVSTVLAIGLFVAGLVRLGASRTALVSMLEPVVTVGLAAWLLHEQLGPLQLAGGALVLGGALLLITERVAPAA